MSISFADSQTRLNLMRAFAGECQARTRYTFAAELAKTKHLKVLEEVFSWTALKGYRRPLNAVTPVPP